MSDSVANLTVKVDTKSVAAAIKALDALASKAGAVEKSVGNIGAAAKKQSEGTRKAADETAKAERALAKMEARIEKAAQQYEKFNRMMNKYTLDSGVRSDLQNRVNREFERHNRIISNVSASQRDLNASTERYKNTLRQLEESVKTAATLQKEKAKALKETERQAAKTAAMEASAAKQQASNLASIEAAIQRARTAVSGISLRAGRQTPMEQAFRIDADAQRALSRYTDILNQYGARSIEARRASGEFNRTLQGLSNEIAKTGGLLTRVSDNARVFSAAFGAANASLGGFSRMAFNTAAALSALSGTLALREVIQAGLEIDKFINTLKTVSEGTLGFQRNLNFLFDEANRVGFAVGDVGNSFARLSLAMKGAGFQGGETRQVFSELVAASRNFGLSSADTMGVVRALEQSMSKGKFMAEEVRLQMGDRLPVAMAALERAVTKVDGKSADLNKRFEEGTIDVQRYAVEFVKQIYAMSGGAETLGRTSQSVGAAFGRLTTELTKTNMLFKEAGFDQALISVTDQLRGLIETARQSGAVEVFAKATLTLANNIDLLAGALGALAASSILRILAGLMSKWVLLGTVVAGVGVAIAAALRGPERELTMLDQDMKSFERTYIKLKNEIQAANTSVANSISGMADSAKTDLEKVAESYEKMGFAASVALGKALRANAAEREKEVRELEKKEIEAYERLTNSFQQIFGKQIDAIYTALGDPAKQEVFANLNDNFLTAQINLVEYSNKLMELTSGLRNATAPANDLVTLLKNPENFNANSLIQAIQRFSGLAQAIGVARAQVTALRGEAASLESGGSIPSPPPSEPIQPPIFNFGRYTSIQAAQDQKAGLKILQEAYRQVTGDTRILTDATSFLTSVRVRAAAGDRDAARVLKDYDDALAKNDKAVSGAEKSISKYTDTLEAEIAAQEKITQAYRQSTLAGEEAEIQLKAQTEAIRLANGDQKKYADLIKQLPPLLQKQAQGERDKEAAKGTTKQREDELTYLQLEKTLIGESVLVREQELAALRERQRLQGASPSLIADAEALARQTVRLRQENEYFKNSYEELGRIGERAFEQVGDAITEAFSKGEIRALNFGNIVRGVMSSILQSIIRLGVINPVLNSLFSGTMRPTLGAGLSVLGAGGAVAGAAGGGGGLMDLLGLSSLIPKEGILGSLGISGPGGLLSTSIFAPQAPLMGAEALLAAGEPGLALSGIPGVTTATGGLTIGSFLGAAGLGFGAGNFLNSMLGGNQTGGMVGSGLGSAAGALLAGAGLLGPLGPIGAALIGGLAGGGLGGLVGPKPSVQGYGFRLQSAGYGPDATPENAMATSLLPISRQFFNESGRQMFEAADQLVQSTNEYLKARGLMVGGVSVVGGNRFGPDYSWADAGSLEEAFTRLRFGAGASNEDLNRALSTRTFTGLEKLQEFVEGFISIQDTIKGLTKDPIPEFTQQMNALIDSFAQAAAKAREYGISEDDLNDARDAGIAKLEKQRALTIRDTALGLEIRRLTALGLDQQAEQIQLSYNTQKEIESFTASLDALALTAEEKSKMLVKLEEVQAEERAAIMRESTRGISDFLDSLRVGGLSGTTGMGRLASAGELFSRDLAAAQTGDRTALQRITQSSETYLNLAREIYGSTSAFHGIRSGVVSSLENLVSNPVGQQLLNISDVPFVKEMAGLGQTAFESASLEYNKQFNDKLESLLPIAEAIKTAVEKTADVQTYVAQQDFMFDAESGAGGFGGDMGGGGGMAAALGAALYHGKVMAYANGGIPDYVNSPTLAPMALFGEAGPEAIMPLRRGPDGRLGVEVNGGNTQAVVGELRAVRNAIESLEETVARNDADQGSALLEAVSGLQIQIGELREELRTSRLRAQ